MQNVLGLKEQYWDDLIWATPTTRQRIFEMGSLNRKLERGKRNAELPERYASIRWF